MGCCLSAGRVTAPPVSAAKTPPHIEEESVKEVVVQSVSVSAPVPLPVPVSVPIPVSDPEPEPVLSALAVADSEPNLPTSLPTTEISQNKSDICSVSVSHSFSTATTATAASILEDDALSKPHRPPPPASRRSRPDRINRSPGERYSPQGKLRPRLSRERPSGQPNPIHNRRNVDSSPLPRSGPLDGPRRRSRSPATRGPSSARRSPMKRREGPVEKQEGKFNKAEVKVAVEVKKEDAEVAVEVQKEDVAVKDPEVSMECFIFI